MAKESKRIVLLYHPSDIEEAMDSSLICQSDQEKEIVIARKGSSRLPLLKFSRTTIRIPATQMGCYMLEKVLCTNTTVETQIFEFYVVEDTLLRDSITSDNLRTSSLSIFPMVGNLHPRKLLSSKFYHSEEIRPPSAV